MVTPDEQIARVEKTGAKESKHDGRRDLTPVHDSIHQNEI